MLEKYIKAFSNLRADKDRNRYPAITSHRAPHKPFLLLSIMDLIAQGQITSDFIEPSFELAQTWNGCYASFMPPGSSTSMALCRLCHWSFDEGLMGVGKKYEVLVSKRVQVEQNLPGHILTLRDRNIFTPEEDKFRPAQENLEKHRHKTFIK
jgi:predicted restriction endonuclease